LEILFTFFAIASLQSEIADEQVRHVRVSRTIGVWLLQISVVSLASARY
jgi:hypothetical protein